MMGILSGIVVTLSASPALSLVTKGTVVLALGLITAWFARRSSAAVRHALLASAFCVLLALPIVSLLAPPIPIAVPVANGDSTVRPVFDYIPAPSSGELAAARFSDIPAKADWPLFSLSTLLLYGWIIGAVLFLFPIVRALLHVRSLRRYGLPWRDGQVVAGGLALGGRGRIEVLLHESLPGPMTCGVLNAAIFLPADAPGWDKQDLERALVHELEHVRRYDWAIHCLARVACAAYWFHPLVWVAWRRLALEAERSCDDAVLAKSEAIAYADQLVGLARRRRLSAAQKSPALAMANRSDLSVRVGAVLDSRQARGRAGAITVTLVCAIAMLLIVTMSPLIMVAAESHVAPAPMLVVQMAQVQPPASDRPKEPATAPKFEVASIRLCNPNESSGVARSGTGGSAAPPTPERLTIHCESTDALILYAYDIYANGRPPQLNDARTHLSPPIEGAPSWVRSERYRIEAKPDRPATLDLMRGPMLQNLLEDRFQLKMHRQPREVPGYALTVAKGGPKLTPFPDGGCWHTGEQPDPERPLCGMNRPEAARRGREPGAPLLWDVPGLNANGIAKLLERYLNRPVVDRTGITGIFEVRMEFAWDEAITPLIQRPCSPDCGPPTGPDPNGVPSIFTAVQHQLGLKLEPIKSSADTLVIDHIERPTEN